MDPCSLSALAYPLSKPAQTHSLLLAVSINCMVHSCNMLIKPGPPRWSELRLNLPQAFQAIGTVVAPVLASYVLFKNVGQVGDTSLQSIQWVYLGTAIFVISLAADSSSPLFRKLQMQTWLPRPKQPRMLLDTPISVFATNILFLGRCGTVLLFRLSSRNRQPLHQLRDDSQAITHIHSGGKFARSSASTFRYRPFLRRLVYEGRQASLYSTYIYERHYCVHRRGSRDEGQYRHRDAKLGAVLRILHLPKNLHIVATRAR